MGSRRTKHLSLIGVLAALLLVLTGLLSPAGAAIARKASLKVSPSLQYVGTAVTFSGNVSKSGKNAVVKIQRKSGSTWVAAGQTRTTTTTGAYSLKLNLPSTAGAYTYRTLAPKTTKYAGVYSNTVAVTALRRTTATIAANPTSISTGGSSTLSGTVSPFAAGSEVTIQKLSGGSWVTDGTATVGASGGYSRPVSPTATTTYRTAVPRNGLNAGTASPSVTVTVSQVPAPVVTTTSLPQGDKGVPYPATTLTKSGGTGGPGTWSISAGQLPAGITLNGTTGVLSGTPTAGGTSNFTVTFTQTGGGAGSKALSIVVTPSPTITTATLPDAARGAAYSVTLAKTGGAGTWEITGLPKGLTLNAATGVISGTTAGAPGTYGVYPVFTETSTGRQVLKALALVVTGPALAITTANPLPTAVKGQPYSVQLTKTGLDGTWSSLPLPDGLTLNPTTGVLSGTPTVAGDNSVFIGFTETATEEATAKGFLLTVDTIPRITTTTVPDGTTGSAYSQQLAKVGGEGTWEVATGTLPPGITLGTTTGLLSGTPTATGDYGFTVSFTETTGGSSDTQGLLLHVSAPGAPVISTTTLPDGTVGTAYSATLAATPAGGTWSVVGDPPPPGTTLNPTTGELSGTPNTAATYIFLVKYTTATSSNTKYLAIRVKPAPVPEG